jgi:D-aspartate ligase
VARPSRPTPPPTVLLGGDLTAVSVARSLGRSGVPVYVLSEARDPVRRSRFCVEFVDLGAGDGVQDRWLEWLRAAPRGAVVLPCADDGLELVARQRSLLLELGLVPIEADDDVLLAMLDKQQTYELARAAGIPVPPSAQIRDRAELRSAAAEIGFPCALKPRHSHLFRRHFRLKGFVAHDYRELEAYYRPTRALGLEMMISELVPGPDDRYSSIYTYLDEQGEPLLAFTMQKLRQYPIRLGSGCYHRTDWDPEAAELGLRFCRAAGVRGLANVEFKRDPRDEELKLIECNQRFIGPNELIRAAGLDLALFTYNRLVGLPPPPLKGYRRGMTMWRPLDDLRAARAYRRRGELSPGAWLRSVLRPHTFRFASLDDPMPMIASSAQRVSNAWRKLGRTRFSSC